MSKRHYGTEFERGADGLYCACDSRIQKPNAQMRIRWTKTRTPASLPALGTPARHALEAGEEVWYPVYVLRPTKPDPIEGPGAEEIYTMEQLDEAADIADAAIAEAKRLASIWPTVLRFPR